MFARTIRPRVVAVCATVLAAVSMVHAPASAQQRNMVILGDSVISDPNAPQ